MKVKDLNPDLIEQLVALESQNILPILASVGIHLTSNDMREQLNIFRESELVLSETNGIVDGFAIYDTKDQDIMIITFNLRKFNSGLILGNLLTQILRKLNSSPVQNINSRAHHTNLRSINFHRKMGFKEVGSNDKFLEFRISKEDLLNIIKRRVCD